MQFKGVSLFRELGNIIRFLLLYQIPAFTGRYLASIYTVTGNHLPTFCVYRLLASLFEEKYNYRVGLMISKYFSLCVDNILYIKPHCAFDSHHYILNILRCKNMGTYAICTLKN